MRPLRSTASSLAITGFLLVQCTALLPTTALAQAYKRADWKHWSDFDQDCLNTRHELLQERSEGAIKFKPRSHCRVIRGRWTDPYTGKIWYRAEDVDIDHVIPLKWAHEHGGASWSPLERERFANDPNNLLIVEDDLNHAKGAQGPDQWLPPKNRCWYKQKWKDLLTHYRLNSQGLNLNCTDLDQISELASTATPTPSESHPTFSCDTSKTYCREMQSCAEAVFYLQTCNLKRLDGDGDGVPCESICR